MVIINLLNTCCFFSLFYLFPTREVFLIYNQRTRALKITTEAQNNRHCGLRTSCAPTQLFISYLADHRKRTESAIKVNSNPCDEKFCHERRLCNQSVSACVCKLFMLHKSASSEFIPWCVGVSTLMKTYPKPFYLEFKQGFQEGVIKTLIHICFWRLFVRLPPS